MMSYFYFIFLFCIYFLLFLQKNHTFDVITLYYVFVQDTQYLQIL